MGCWLALFFLLCTLSTRTCAGDNNNTSSSSSPFTFPYTGYLQNQFTQAFYDRCWKYSVFREYTRQLENGHLSNRRFVVFVFHQKRLRNGGLGDRLAGLISAMNFAIRFNRTLLVRSENKIGRLFSPFHPLPEVRARLSYENWTQWATGYNPSWENHDETEHDMWYCINNVGTGSPRCSLEWGDVNQQIILLRSNRCYLCRDWNLPPSVASHQDLLHLLSGEDKPKGNHSSSSSSDSDRHPLSPDLYELGGCMLRMAFWPTDLLWKEVDRYYSEVAKDLHLTEKLEFDERRRSKQRRRKLSANGKKKKGGASTGPFYQIGMHFRCGDHAYISGTSFDSHCIYNGTYLDFTAKETSHAYNGAMVEGTPYDLGKCAARVAENQTNWLVDQHIPIAGRGESIEPSSQLLLSMGASDNFQSTKQMIDVSLSSNNRIGGGLLSPSGCHIELQDSFECLLITVSTWFALSLSDAIVIQTIRDARYPIPSSAFSRYAGLYSLKRNVFRDARHCDEIPDHQVMGISQQGNWFC
eukprot:gene7515-8312_t